MSVNAGLPVNLWQVQNCQPDLISGLSLS